MAVEKSRIYERMEPRKYIKSLDITSGQDKVWNSLTKRHLNS